MNPKLLFICIAMATLLSVRVEAGVYDDILVAANNGQTEQVIDFLRRGLDVNTTDREGATLLLIAARTGNLGLAQFLVANRASLMRPNRYGDTALHLAASQGHIQMVKLLVDSGAEINSSGWTPLQYAIYSGHLEIASYLIDKGADLEARAPNGRTVLMLAAQMGRQDAAEKLIRAGAKVDVKDFDQKGPADIAREKGFSALADYLAKQSGLAR
jgi:uncharacterized protein